MRAAEQNVHYEVFHIGKRVEDVEHQAPQIETRYKQFQSLSGYSGILLREGKGRERKEKGER